MSQKCPICNNELEDGAQACAYCGFKLLGATQSFKPVKIDGDHGIDAKRPTQRRALRIIRGPQTGVELALREGVMTMGRDPQCDIFLNDMTVSREHASLEIGEKGCVIRDQNSFNGVWVNDQMVDVCLLKSGDVVQLGVFCVVYSEQ